MEQKYNNNDWICKILLEFCELEGEEIAYRKGNQPEARLGMVVCLRY